MYDGPIEVFVTPGDVIYTTEVEKLCVLTSYKPSVASPNQPSSSLPLLDLEESLNLTSNTILLNNHNGGSGSGSGDNSSGNSSKSNGAVEPSRSSNVHTNPSAEQVLEENMNKIIESRTRHHHHTHHSHPQQQHQVRSASSVVIESLRGSQQFDPLFNPPPTVVKPWQCALMVCVPVRLGEFNVSPMYIQVGFIVSYV